MAQTLTQTPTKRITLSTVKSFIKKNQGNIFINVKSDFDSMEDCCTKRDGGFKPASKDDRINENTLGISGAWFVGSSRDYFHHYEDDTFAGIEIYNCCGTFILAIKK